MHVTRPMLCSNNNMPSKKKKSKAAKGRKPAVGKGRTKAEENVSIKHCRKTLEEIAALHTPAVSLKRLQTCASKSECATRDDMQV